MLRNSLTCFGEGPNPHKDALDMLPQVRDMLPQAQACSRKVRDISPARIGLPTRIPMSRLRCRC